MTRDVCHMRFRWKIAEKLLDDQDNKTSLCPSQKRDRMNRQRFVNLLPLPVKENGTEQTQQFRKEEPTPHPPKPTTQKLKKNHSRHTTLHVQKQRRPLCIPSLNLSLSTKRKNI